MVKLQPAHELAATIRSVRDFPKKGIIFRDITTLLKEPKAFRKAVGTFVEQYKKKGIQKVVGVESRGFIMGGALAHELGAGFVPLRKPGKLPAETLKEQYSLEYGTDSIEMHVDAIGKNEKVLIHDDLLATGGTAAAACRLVERAGGRIVGIAFLVELSFLRGREHLGDYDIFSIIRYESEE